MAAQAPAPLSVKADMANKTTPALTLFFGAGDELGWLSQMHISKFKDPNFDVEFNCNEQYFQVLKAKVFGDTSAFDKIMKAEDPKVQKRLGRQVRGFDDKKWEKHAFKVVLDANKLRFTVSEHAPRLRPLLLATNNSLIAEASPYDRIWGLGLGKSAALSYQKENKQRPGSNLLGKALMEVRRELVEENTRNSTA